jgi:hypothetical protein
MSGAECLDQRGVVSNERQRRHHGQSNLTERESDRWCSTRAARRSGTLDFR